MVSVWSLYWSYSIESESCSLERKCCQLLVDQAGVGFVVVVVAYLGECDLRLWNPRLHLLLENFDKVCART